MTSPRGKRARASLQRALPKPAYQRLVGTYNAARALAGRGKGAGRALPDFLIIGAAKAGTTSLFRWLGEHPFVVPATLKEVRYFDHNYFRGIDWYRIHFPLESDRDGFTAQHGRPFLTGEASPGYLSNYWAPERLAKIRPDAKLIVMLRNPADRAHSHFQMSRREGEEPIESFEQALDLEEERLAPERARMRTDRHYASWPYKTWSYQDRGLYAEQLERWFPHFPSEQFHIVTLDELSAEPAETLGAVHEFLGLPAHRPPDLPRMNALTYNSLPPATRHRLEGHFRVPNQRLYELLGRDLGWRS